MLRQIIIPEQKHIVLELPDDYLHQEVEIIVFPIKTTRDSTVAPADPLAVFDDYQECFDGKFNREELYDR